LRKLSLIAVLSTQLLPGCAVIALGPDGLKYNSQKKDMFEVQEDIEAGLATEIAPVPVGATGVASFSGHIAVYDNDVNTTELLFGDASLTVDFEAATDQLSGTFSNFRLVDSEGTRVYGIPAASVEEHYAGTLAVVGTADADSIPFSAEGELTDEGGAAFDLRIVGDARLYEYEGGAQAISSAGATGFLTDEDGAERLFSTGFMSATE
jgi:hypothetical protein